MKKTISETFENFFHESPQAIGQAPGRIEFIGNHTDYNGGFVMGVAIDKTIVCTVCKRADRQLCFGNANSGETVFVDMDKIERQADEHNWANYPLGVFKFLLQAGLKAGTGFNLIDHSTLPSGAGLSSSAAIELSSAFALAKLYDFQTDRKTLVKIGRKSENEFVGVPSGILDQGVSGFGKADTVVFIDCLKEEFSNYPLPHDCKFWLFNSTKKHALVDGLYAARHDECTQAAQILSQGGPSRLLCAFTQEDLQTAQPKMTATVYKRARHVIEENARVLQARDLLLSGDIAGVGQLLYASHESSKTLFENSTPELDFLVDEAKKHPNIHGARLSGGGFGGAVMALTDASFNETQAQQIAAAYATHFGAPPAILTCASGDGAKTV